IEDHGLKPEQLVITDSALAAIIDEYTREAGVRKLERKVATVVRGVAVKVAEGQEGPFTIAHTADLKEFLGPPRYTSEVAERTSETGVSTGLAWTAVGGEILFIEATKMHGTGKLQLTGQLGDVMKESAQAAVTLAKVVADPCPGGYPEGAVFYNDTADIVCLCDGAGADLKISDGSACF
ncbi:hypothetical protein KDL45_13345, partial [bacterium]|nr:hypothetical protein [bacterium]